MSAIVAYERLSSASVGAMRSASPRCSSRKLWRTQA